MSGMPEVEGCDVGFVGGVGGVGCESMGPSPVSSHLGSTLENVSIIFDTHRLEISVPLFIHLEITPLEQPISCSNALILMPSSFIIRAILSEILSIVENFAQKVCSVENNLYLCSVFKNKRAAKDSEKGRE